MKNKIMNEAQHFAKSLKTIQLAGSFTSPAYQSIFDRLCSFSPDVPVYVPESLHLVKCIVEPPYQPQGSLEALNELLKSGLFCQPKVKPSSGIEFCFMPLHINLLADALRNKKLTRQIPADQVVPVMAFLVLEDINESYPEFQVPITPYQGIPLAA